MATLTRSDLYSLEKYAEVRDNYRAAVIAHKKNRRLALNPHMTLYFEDAVTVQYQIQEMLRIERVFEAAGIQAELDVYNPMIPDGHNWKATFMIEYSDPAERKRALADLIGVERQVWLQVAAYEPVYAIADEDLARTALDKTASVHFMRFELTPDLCAALKKGAGLRAGIDHSAAQGQCDVPDNVCISLIGDLV